MCPPLPSPSPSLSPQVQNYEVCDSQSVSGAVTESARCDGEPHADLEQISLRCSDPAINDVDMADTDGAVTSMMLLRERQNEPVSKYEQREVGYVVRHSPLSRRSPLRSLQQHIDNNNSSTGSVGSVCPSTLINHPPRHQYQHTDMEPPTVIRIDDATRPAPINWMFVIATVLLAMYSITIHMLWGTNISVQVYPRSSGIKAVDHAVMTTSMTANIGSSSSGNSDVTSYLQLLAAPNNDDENETSVDGEADTRSTFQGSRWMLRNSSLNSGERGDAQSSALFGISSSTTTSSSSSGSASAAAAKVLSLDHKEIRIRIVNSASGTCLVRTGSSGLWSYFFDEGVGFASCEADNR